MSRLSCGHRIVRPLSSGPAVDAQPVLRIQSLCKTYRSGLHGCTATARALDGVELEIALGEIVALVGPPGAGKTTLLLCAAGLLAPDEGAIERLWCLADVPPAIMYFSDAVLAKAGHWGVALIDNIDRVRGDVTAAFALLSAAKHVRGKHASLLMAARDATSVKHVADRVVRIEHGRIQSVGVPAHLSLAARVAEESLR